MISKIFKRCNLLFKTVLIVLLINKRLLFGQSLMEKNDSGIQNKKLFKHFQTSTTFSNNQNHNETNFSLFKTKINNAHSSIDSLLTSQKPLDCQQFDKDLIECFAYNLFLKNSYKFQDLDSENVLMRPILTKQFENKSVEVGKNATFTCQTQIEALPIFLFYKLNKDIIKIFNSLNNEMSAQVLNKYADLLQDSKAFNDYATLNPRILLERRRHLEDSNKDHLSDLETIHLIITKTTKLDSGFYLCIVANSLRSFRVTYAYLDVTDPISNKTQWNVSNVENGVVSLNKIFTNKDDLITLFYEHKILIVSLTILILLTITCISVSICCCCHQCFRKSDIKNNGETIKNIELISKTSFETSKFGSIIEKTMNSMKKNLMYISMQNPSSTESIDFYTLKRNSSTLLLNENKYKTNLETNTIKHNQIGITNNKFHQKNLFSKNNIISKETVFSNRINFDLFEESCQSEFPREKLKLGRLLDEGAFGKVYMADAYGIIPGRYKTIVAVKMLKENSTETEYVNFLKELEIMKIVGKHENIINLLGKCTKNGPLYAIVEYAKFGNLRNYIRSQRPKDYMLYSDKIHYMMEKDDYDCDVIGQESNENNIENILKLYSKVNMKKKSNIRTINSFESNCLKKSNNINSNAEINLFSSDSTESLNLIIDLIKFSVQISNGMKFLHSKKVCHRDLAARNILLSEYKVAKIADFGFARDLQQNYYYKRRSEAPIPVKWMAPECLFDQKVYPNSDIWSFGILMWEIFTLGGNPYPSVPIEKLFDYLKEGNRMSKPMYADAEIYQLMLDCWNFKSDMRPSFDVINQQLTLILEKYEIKKTQYINDSFESSKLFNESSRNALKNVGINSMSNNTSLKKNIDFNLSSKKFTNLLTINPITISNDELLTSLSASSNASFSGNNTYVNNSNDYIRKYLNINGKNNDDENKKCSFDPKRLTRQSESESDSQYFSGADNSLVYGENSNYSSASSYTNYSVPLTADAVKAASMMTASLSQTPPSPPPIKPSKQLLKIVASAAYKL